MPAWLVITCAIVALIGGLFGIAGAVWRWVVLPNLREQLIRPVQETHKQVTVNGGRNNPPTLLDKVGEVDASLKKLRQDFVDHLVNASREQADMWRAIEAIAKSTPPDEL